MKFLIVFALAVACVVADPAIKEWVAQYGSYPTGHAIKLKYDAPIVKVGSPLINYESPMIKYDEDMEKYESIAKLGSRIYAPVIKYDEDMEKFEAPILKYDAPMYYRLAPKAYNLPAGYRVSYDPENFNEAFGFYPDYKK